jgi:hypothetical protein
MKKVLLIFILLFTTQHAKSEIIYLQCYYNISREEVYYNFVLDTSKKKVEILNKLNKKKFKSNSNLELKKNTYYWKFYDTSTSTEFLFKIDKFFQKTSIEYKKKFYDDNEIGSFLNYAKKYIGKCNLL